jgi:hypothetical protein
MLTTNFCFMIGLASIPGIGGYRLSCATMGDADADSGFVVEAAPWMTVSPLGRAGANATGLGGFDAPRMIAPLVCVQPAITRLSALIANKRFMISYISVHGEAGPPPAFEAPSDSARSAAVPAFVRVEPVSTSDRRAGTRYEQARRPRRTTPPIRETENRGENSPLSESYPGRQSAQAEFRRASALVTALPPAGLRLERAHG